MGVLSPWRWRAGNVLQHPAPCQHLLAGERGHCWGEGEILGLWLLLVSPSAPSAHFCSRESESPLSPAPSQDSRCKVLPPHVLCPGTQQGSSCPIPAISSSCPSCDTRDSQRLSRTFPQCLGRLRSPPSRSAALSAPGPFPVPPPPFPAPRAPAAPAPLPGAWPGRGGGSGQGYANKALLCK